MSKTIIKIIKQRNRNNNKPPSKSLLNWTKVKTALHHGANRPPTLQNGEVWWCSVGENIGVEINGKGPYSLRPVLVFHKINRHSFIGVPLTSQPKVGTWYYRLTFNGRASNAALHQIRVMSSARALLFMGKVPLGTLKEIHLSLIRQLQP